MRGIVGFGFWAVVRGAGRRSEYSCRGRGWAKQQRVAAIDAQGAIELVGEFDGFSGVAAMAGQGRQGDGVGAQGDDVVGGDHALIAQAEAAGQIEAAGQASGSRGGLGGRTGEALVVVGAEAGEHGVGLRTVVARARRSSLTRRSWQVRQARSMRPLAWGE